ncbi:MAG: hypothetical protein WCS03_02180 [Bacteroidota bacterium]
MTGGNIMGGFFCAFFLTLPTGLVALLVEGGRAIFLHLFRPLKVEYLSILSNYCSINILFVCYRNFIYEVFAAYDRFPLTALGAERRAEGAELRAQGKIKIKGKRQK